MLVFWPHRARGDEGAIVYGWVLRGCVVVAAVGETLETCQEVGRVVPEETDVDGGKDTLLLFRSVNGHISLDGSIIITYSPPNTRNLQLFSTTPLIPTREKNIRLTKGESSLISSEKELSKKLLMSLSLDPTSARGRLDCLPLDEALEKINSIYSLKKNKKHRRQRVTLDRVTALADTARGLTLGWAPLKSYLASFRQLDTRIDQLLVWPSHFNTTQRALDTPEQFATGCSLYISMYNTLWLIANDVIIGKALGNYVCENSTSIALSLDQFARIYTRQFMQESLVWLNSWPGGVKLNHEIGLFILKTFVFFSDLWETHILSRLTPLLPAVVYSIGIAGSFCGATLLLACFSDLLSLFTIYLYALYILSTQIYAWHTTALLALFRIFRGKKYNVLRGRVEAADYDLDELMLGTLLFTLAGFLFPTILSYYVVFVSSRIAVVYVHFAIEVAISFLNYFPLFAVMLRFKDPARLPGGICFDIGTDSLCLRNNPLSLSAIFSQFIRLFYRLMSHYSPFRLGMSIARGRNISTLSSEALSLD